MEKNKPAFQYFGCPECGGKIFLRQSYVQSVGAEIVEADWKEMSGDDPPPRYRCTNCGTETDELRMYEECTAT